MTDNHLVCRCDGCWASGKFADSHICKQCGLSRAAGPCACSFDVPVPKKKRKQEQP